MKELARLGELQGCYEYLLSEEATADGRLQRYTWIREIQAEMGWDVTPVGVCTFCEGRAVSPLAALAGGTNSCKHCDGSGKEA